MTIFWFGQMYIQTFPSMTRAMIMPRKIETPFARLKKSL